MLTASRFPTARLSATFLPYAVALCGSFLAPKDRAVIAAGLSYLAVLAMTAYRRCVAWIDRTLSLSHNATLTAQVEQRRASMLAYRDPAYSLPMPSLAAPVAPEPVEMECEGNEPLPTVAECILATFQPLSEAIEPAVTPDNTVNAMPRPFRQVECQDCRTFYFIARRACPKCGQRVTTGLAPLVNDNAFVVTLPPVCFDGLTATTLSHLRRRRWTHASMLSWCETNGYAPPADGLPAFIALLVSATPRKAAPRKAKPVAPAPEPLKVAPEPTRKPRKPAAPKAAEKPAVVKASKPRKPVTPKAPKKPTAKPAKARAAAKGGRPQAKGRKAS